MRDNVSRHAAKGSMSYHVCGWWCQNSYRMPQGKQRGNHQGAQSGGTGCQQDWSCICTGQGDKSQAALIAAKASTCICCMRPGHPPLGHNSRQFRRQLVQITPNSCQRLSDLPLTVVPERTPLHLTPVPQLPCKIRAVPAAAAAATPATRAPSAWPLLLPVLAVVLLLMAGLCVLALLLLLLLLLWAALVIPCPRTV